MKIAVLSGKGGTGKTFVSVNLAENAPSAFYLDCDVEEPNGHLFFKPEQITIKPVYKKLPVFLANKCNGCRKCVEFCKFHALAFVGEKPKVFKDVCHSCGGCMYICPSGAVTEEEHEIGHVECGLHKNVKVVTGMLNIGESSGVGVIKEVLRQAEDSDAEHVIIDCPPGSACTVMESIDQSDYCILVAEPTIFGLHNFKMVYELVQLLKKRCGVVINKAPEEETVLDHYCKEHQIKVLCRIPYSKETAKQGANALIVSEADENMKKLFQDLLKKVEKEAE